MLQKDAKLEFEKLAGKEWTDDYFKSVDELTAAELEQHNGVLFLTYHRLKNITLNERRSREGKKKSLAGSYVAADASKLSGDQIIRLFVKNSKTFRGVVSNSNMSSQFII